MRRQLHHGAIAAPRHFFGAEKNKKKETKRRQVSQGAAQTGRRLRNNPPARNRGFPPPRSCDWDATGDDIRGELGDGVPSQPMQFREKQRLPVGQPCSTQHHQHHFFVRGQVRRCGRATCLALQNTWRNLSPLQDDCVNCVEQASKACILPLLPSFNQLLG
jgi:hypothetical protein